ncbi:hypothetical protein BDR07DRAFT_1613133 [Suillus spraguei]|nr:hypothetical protein BDR07DRAFT_1613133 [Suillus spraguei]
MAKSPFEPLKRKVHKAFRRSKGKKKEASKEETEVLCSQVKAGLMKTVLEITLNHRLRSQRAVQDIDEIVDSSKGSSHAETRNSRAEASALVSRTYSGGTVKSAMDEENVHNATTRCFSRLESFNFYSTSAWAFFQAYMPSTWGQEDSYTKSYNSFSWVRGTTTTVKHRSLTINDITFITTIIHHPTNYLDELQHELCSRLGVFVSIPTLFRTLHRLHLNRKCIPARALERNKEICAISMNSIAEMAPDPEMSIFGDEGANDERTTIQRHGRSKIGTRYTSNFLSTGT